MIGGMTGLFRDNPLRPSLGTPEKKAERPPSEKERRTSKKVFISYTHRDLEVTSRLRRELESHGLRIVIDVDALPPGKSIRKFIEESVKSSDAIISIVSRHSLMSTWVALETVTTLRHDGKQLFGCYVDADFLSRGFVAEAQRYVASQMDEIGDMIKQRIDNQESFEDLYQDLEDHRRLRSNIDKIVRQLRDTLCLSLHQDVFEANCEKLAKALGA